VYAFHYPILCICLALSILLNIITQKNW
jgi:hypothetical protein